MKFSKNGDWVVAEDTDGVLWSFAPSNHPAYPAVGRRKLIEQDGTFFVETRLLCEAKKPACDKLHADYPELDRRMTEAIRGRR